MALSKNTPCLKVLVPNKKTIKAIKEARLLKTKSFKTIDDLMIELNAKTTNLD
jgi:hypothetical protein